MYERTRHLEVRTLWTTHSEIAFIRGIGFHRRLGRKQDLPPVAKVERLRLLLNYQEALNTHTRRWDDGVDEKAVQAALVEEIAKLLPYTCKRDACNEQVGKANTLCAKCEREKRNMYARAYGMSQQRIDRMNGAANFTLQGR